MFRILQMQYILSTEQSKLRQSINIFLNLGDRKL